MTARKLASTTARDTAAAARPVERVTAQELAKAIRRQIQMGAMKPEEWLRESRLCAEFGVGRSTVREALRLLLEDGLVRFERNRGAYVAPVSLYEMFDLFEVRAALFGLVCRFACFRGAEALLRDVLLKIEVLIDAGERLTPAEDRISQGIEIVSMLTGAANEDTRKMMRASNRKARWQYSSLGLAESPGSVGPIDHWRKLAAALERRDADEAAEAARRIIYFMQHEVTRAMIARGLGSPNADNTKAG